MDEATTKFAAKLYAEAAEINKKEKARCTTFSRAVLLVFLPSNFHTLEDAADVLTALKKVHQKAVNHKA